MCSYSGSFPSVISLSSFLSSFFCSGSLPYFLFVNILFFFFREKLVNESSELSVDTLCFSFRFVYQDLSSTKVDTKVIFPQDGMDVRGFLSGPSSNDLVYDLYSIVCHFGGASAGHYTCYAKHPLTSQWYYYNDETVSQQTPSSSEYSSGYVLYYQRQGKRSLLYLCHCGDLLYLWYSVVCFIFVSEVAWINSYRKLKGKIK